MHGGTNSEDWKIETAIGDNASSTGVRQELYHQMRDKPAPVDLGQLWNKLRLAVKNGDVTFNTSFRSCDSPDHHLATILRS